MNANKAIITGIFNNATLVEVPFFQRPYVWDEDLWSRFIEDMEFVVKTKRPHFFGAIILKDNGNPGPGSQYASHLTIVDGQQRLTTYLLFMKVLCLKLKQPSTFDLQFRIMGQDIALRHGKNDYDAFKLVTSATEAALIDNPEPKSQIIEAFNYFVDNIDESKLDIMSVIMNAQFVRIDLSPEEDEQQIFDAINSLGVRLTTAELLKNYFYSRQDIQEYEKSWVSVFEKDNEVKAYWNREFEAGRITRSMIDVFFDAYFQLFVQDTYYKVSAEDKILYDRVDNLAKSYQDFIKKYCGGDKQVILRPMSEYAEKFSEIFDLDALNRQVNKDSNTQRINVVIFGLKTSTLIPYILYIAMNSAPEEYDKMLEILESYIMRRIVVRATTKNYNNLFSSLILNKVNTAEELLNALKQGSDSTTYVPSDVALLDGFNTSRITNLQAKGIIFFIETSMRTEKNSTAMLSFNQYSLEHLMPRKWRNHWAPCDTLEEARARDYKLATLGNFAIITQSLNTSISDSDWTTKKAGKNNNPGLSQYASGLLTMDAVLKEEVWDESKIEARAQWLFEKAKDIWSSVLPAVVEGGGYVDKSGNSAELRKRFWTYALPKIKAANIKLGSFLNCNPHRYNELWGSFGIGGCNVGCIANYDQAYVWFNLGTSSKDRNKELFDILYSHKDEINKTVGTELNWSRADEYKASWITYKLKGVSIGNESDWPAIVDFLATWSSKISEAMVPYLMDGSSEEARFARVSSWVREWVINRKDITFDIKWFSRHYARFTTERMSSILPEINDTLSSWNTASHYLYEVHVQNSGNVQLQMTINSKGINDEYRAICNRIQKYYPSGSDESDWTYRTPFKTKRLVFDGNDKDVLFKYLDDCMEQLHTFEKDLQEKMSKEA